MTRFLRHLFHRFFPPRNGYAGTYMGWPDRPMRIVDGQPYQLGYSCPYQSIDVTLYLFGWPSLEIVRIGVHLGLFTAFLAVSEAVHR